MISSLLAVSNNTTTTRIKTKKWQRCWLPLNVSNNTTTTRIKTRSRLPSMSTSQYQTIPQQQGLRLTIDNTINTTIIVSNNTTTTRIKTCVAVVYSHTGAYQTIPQQQGLRPLYSLSVKHNTCIKQYHNNKD